MDNHDWQIPTTCNATAIACSLHHIGHMFHMAHVGHTLMPCWSVFLRFPELDRYFLFKPEGRQQFENNRWLTELEVAMNVSHVLGSTGPGCSIDITPWHGIEPFYIRPFINWFMDSNDSVELQKQLRLPTTLSSSAPDSRTKVLLLNRKERRSLVEGSQFPAAVEALANASVREGEWPWNVGVTYTESPGASLRAQAELFHSHDIIIAAHGQALCNLVFARRCTVVLEIYPQGTFMPAWFQHRAVHDVGLVAFYSHPSTTPLAEFEKWYSTHASKAFFAALNADLTVSATLLANFLPTALYAHKTCLRRLEREGPEAGRQNFES